MTDPTDCLEIASVTEQVQVSFVRLLVIQDGLSWLSLVTIQAVGLWVFPCWHPEPFMVDAEFGVGEPNFICHLFAPTYERPHLRF